MSVSLTDAGGLAVWGFKDQIKQGVGNDPAAIDLSLKDDVPSVEPVGLQLEDAGGDAVELEQAGADNGDTAAGTLAMEEVVGAGADDAPEDVAGGGESEQIHPLFHEVVGGVNDGTEVGFIGGGCILRGALSYLLKEGIFVARLAREIDKGGNEKTVEEHFAACGHGGRENWCYDQTGKGCSCTLKTLDEPAILHYSLHRANG